MSEIALAGTPLALWVAQLMAIIARLSFVIFMMPGIGEQVVPVRVRLFLLLGLGVLFSGTGVVGTASFSPFSGFLTLILGEVVIGFVLGVMLRLVIWVLSITGAIIAQSIGLSQFMGVAMEHQPQTITANILTMGAATLLLTANHHVNVIAQMLHLYKDVPVGAVSLVAQSFVISNFYSALSFSVMLAWPFAAVNLLYNICLGFINKALPQMMVAFVGAPFMVGAGIILLMLSIASLLMVWQDKVPQLIGWM